jgi:GLPGLI family protein
MRTFFLLFVFILSITINAQDFQGYAIYEAKTKFDIKLDSSKHSKERMDMMKAMMKKFGEKTFKLSFDKTQSTYKEEEKIDKPGQSGMRMFGGFNQGILYKNIKEKRYANQKESFSKLFLIKDSIPTYDWKLHEDSKMIGAHLCFKAMTKKEVSNTRMRRPKKEDEENNDSIPKTKIIEVTAWYTPDIPINNGPRNFSGLPGLILELNVGKSTLLCTKIVINPKEKIEIEEPKKGKKVTQKKYDTIMEKKTKEMMEMYGGGRKRGRVTREVIRLGG